MHWKVTAVETPNETIWTLGPNAEYEVLVVKGFITVIFQLKKSWLLHKNLIPSFLESKYGILGPIFQSGNIFNKPVYDFLKIETNLSILEFWC